MSDHLEPTPGLETVCIDFDGILAENTWPLPQIGNPIPEGISLLRHYYNEGNAIVIYTARPGSHRAAIVVWLQQTGIEQLVYDIVCDKPRAGLYVDDRAYRPPWVDDRPPGMVVPTPEEEVGETPQYGGAGTDFYAEVDEFDRPEDVDDPESWTHVG